MPENTKKSILISILILCVGGVIFTGLWMLKKPPEQKTGELLRSLKVIPLSRETIIPKVFEFAVVASLEEVDIRAEVSGKVVTCSEDMTDGVKVKKGEILVQIEKADYEIAKQQAEAELEILKADKKNLEQNVKDLAEILSEMKKDFELEEAYYKRIKDLYEREVSSKSELERAQQALSRRKKVYIETNTQLSKETFALESVKANTKKAGASLETARLNLRRSSVTTPIDGRIGNCDIEIGEYLIIGQQICTITNDSKPALKVPVDVTEAADILQVKQDEKQWLKLPDTVKVTVSWVKKPEASKWNAEVTRIEDYDSETDTLRILVTPTTYSGNMEIPFRLLPGMFCKIEFSGVPLENAFRIPFSALQFGNNVFTVNAEGILSRHKVKPFTVEGDEVIILSGLPENEGVVIQQLPRGLISGMKVKPMKPREK
jgi:RND family efflux transporter MFP subunit